MQLSNILAAMTELTADELSVVIATATQLKVAKSAGVGRRQTLSGAARGKPNKVRQTKPKGPAKQDSPYKDVPEFQGFKLAEKELRSFLKTKKISLKEANTSQMTRDDPVLVRFREAQAVWFRCKTSLAGQATESSPAKEEGKEAA